MSERSKTQPAASPTRSQALWQLVAFAALLVGCAVASSGPDASSSPDGFVAAPASATSAAIPPAPPVAPPHHLIGASYPAIPIPVDQAEGDLLAYHSGAWDGFAPTTSGFVLTSNGPGVLPTYQAATTVTWANDLAGSTSSSQTVVGWRSRALTAGAPATGNAYYWNGSAWAPSALNLAGGSAFVSGILPIVNGGFGAIGSNGQVFATVGGAAGWDSFGAGDVSFSTSLVPTVTGLRGATIPALTAGYMNYNGSALAFTALPPAGITQLTGRGTAGPGSGSQVFSLAASGITAATYGSASAVAVCVFSADGTASSCTNTTIAAALASATGILGAPLGGTGVASPTAHDVLISEGASAMTPINLGDAQILVGQTAADPAAKTVSGDETMTDTGAVTNTKINGTSVNAGGGLTIGQVLRATGASAATWGAVDLTNSSAVTGALPIANFAPSGTNGQVLTTVSGATTWATPSSGGITQLTGPVTAGPGSGSQVTSITASGVTAGTYPSSASNYTSLVIGADGRITGATNNAILIGNAGLVSSTYGNIIGTGALAAGSLAAGFTPVSDALQAAQTLTGDVGGTTAANVVNKVTAASALDINQPAFTWRLGTGAPTLSQATPTSDVATTNFKIAPQAAFASASTNKTPASLEVDVTAPVSGGSEAGILVKRGATSVSFLGPHPTVGFAKLDLQGSTVAYSNGTALTLASGHTSVAFTPGLLNFGDLYGAGASARGWQFGYPGTATFGGGDNVVGLSDVLTVPTSAASSGGLALYSNAHQLETNASAIRFNSLVSAPIIGEQTALSDVATPDLEIDPQAPFASAVTNVTGGDVAIRAQPPVSGTPESALVVKRSSATVAAMGPFPTNPTTIGGIWLDPTYAPRGTRTGNNANVYGISGSTVVQAPVAAGADLLYAAGTQVASFSKTQAYATLGVAQSDVAPSIQGTQNAQQGLSRKFRAFVSTVGSTAANAFSVTVPTGKTALIHFNYILRDDTTPGIQNNAAEGAYVGAINLSGTTSQFGGMVTYTGGVMRGSQAAVNNITLGDTFAGAVITVTCQLPIATDTYDWTFDVDATFN